MSLLNPKFVKMLNDVGPFWSLVIKITLSLFVLANIGVGFFAFLGLYVLIAGLGTVTIPSGAVLCNGAYAHEAIKYEMYANRKKAKDVVRESNCIMSEKEITAELTLEGHKTHRVKLPSGKEYYVFSDAVKVESTL